jgi:thiol reductant ABC exporter CydC subunit
VSSTLRRLDALAELPRGRAAFAISLGAIALGCAVALPTTAGYLISRAAEQPPVLALTTIIVVVRFLALARPLARYLERLASHDLALRSLGPLRARVYRRIEPLAPAELDAFRRGDLLTRLVGDVDSLQSLYLRGLGPAVAALVVGVGCVVATALLVPAAALVLAAGLAVGGIGAPLLAARLVRGSGRRQASARGELTAELVELLHGAPELVASGREADAIGRMRAADRELVRLARHDALVAGLADAASVAVAGLTTVAVLALAVAAHDADALDRVLVATLALLALSSFEAVAPLPAAARELVGTLAAGRRVLELTAREPAVCDPVDPAPAPNGPATVVVDDVTARYPGAASPAVEHVSLALAPGERVALVGPSGSGKTTVTHLLLRFLDPEAGTVSIGGRDTRTLRQEDVRRTFALAGQEAHVFDSTIRENLKLARPRATDDELVAALGRARLADWVATLPDGLDTLVGEDGARLSGGQRQRLVVARALLADAPVLLLDEPTAHLDSPTAEALVRDVLDAANGRSVLLITHRPEGLELVDRIVVLGATRPEADGATAPVDAR